MAVSVEQELYALIQLLGFILMNRVQILGKRE
jgi:hypothetical protein